MNTSPRSPAQSGTILSSGIKLAKCSGYNTWRLQEIGGQNGDFFRGANFEYQSCRSLSVKPALPILCLPSRVANDQKTYIVASGWTVKD